MRDDTFEDDPTDPAATPDETNSTDGNTEIKIISTVDYWQKNYGRSCEGNDQKAIRIFREYEPHERLRRLQNELMSIKTNMVAADVLHAVVGKKRMQKHQGYDRWASMMLMWIAAKR